jgi:thiamine monophosphate synthase
VRAITEAEDPETAARSLRTALVAQEAGVGTP